MSLYKIPLYEISWDETELKNLREVIESGKYWTGGQTTRNFEKQIASMTNMKYGISFNSGTSALFALIKALELKKGDEIIVPSFTFIATSNSVIYGNGTPIFAEIEEKTYGLDPDDVNEKISAKTKAILPIHYGGGACKIHELQEIAEDNKIFLIEDAAESLGCKVSNNPVGSFGKASIFSFCGNKIITTGEGGMLVTSDEKLTNKITLIRSHGRDDKGLYFQSSESPDYISFGHNWRMSDITAAVGLAQLAKLKNLISLRQEKAKQYGKNLKKCPQLSIPISLAGVSHIYQMYTIRLNNIEDRNSLKTYLTQKGIMTKIFFDCVHLTSYYKNKFNYKEGSLPITEDISKRVLTIPIYPTLKYEDIEYISKQIIDFF